MTTDPLDTVREAKTEIERVRREMVVLADIRAGAIAELEAGGMSRAEIARRLGVSRNTVTRVLRRVE